uniref:Uncharacterized protein n=1 Tax=Streptomyces argenteolus TaxID=67274 RepID=A9ZNU1_9ACTN|nr:hypothetical protein [Streptomyces argenteolus]
MGQLPKPDLPAGPIRNLSDALHDLHHRAGWPSLRRMATAIGCSHTTVSKMFSSPHLLRWNRLELVVDYLNGERILFKDMWYEATRTSSERTYSPAQASQAALASSRGDVNGHGAEVIHIGHDRRQVTLPSRATAGRSTLTSPLLRTQGYLPRIHDFDTDLRLYALKAVANRLFSPRVSMAHLRQQLLHTLEMWHGEVRIDDMVNSLGEIEDFILALFRHAMLALFCGGRRISGALVHAGGRTLELSVQPDLWQNRTLRVLLRSAKPWNSQETGDGPELEIHLGDSTGRYDTVLITLPSHLQPDLAKRILECTVNFFNTANYWLGEMTDRALASLDS